MITWFCPRCPICDLELEMRDRASFAYVELERHLESVHKKNAVRIKAAPDVPATEAWKGGSR